jgi:hypothetical protein
MDPESKILKFPAAADKTSLSDQEKTVDTEVQTTTALLTPPVSQQAPPPVWMQRFVLVCTVVFCLWTGLILAALPWLPAWTENSIISDFPTVRLLLATGFVRGLVTGLGLLDLWIGISEAVTYRDRR